MRERAASGKKTDIAAKSSRGSCGRVMPRESDDASAMSKAPQACSTLRLCSKQICAWALRLLNQQIGIAAATTTNKKFSLICSACAKRAYHRGANRYFIFIKHSFSPVIKHCGSNLKKILPTQPLGLNRISNGFERTAGCAVIARPAVFNVMR